MYLDNVITPLFQTLLSLGKLALLASDESDQDWSIQRLEGITSFTLDFY